LPPYFGGLVEWLVVSSVGNLIGFVRVAEHIFSLDSRLPPAFARVTGNDEPIGLSGLNPI